MPTQEDNNKRILKNTIFLYARQLFTMAVSLFTVRVVLNVLGAENYGIYNVAGSVVVLFSFISTTMATSSQRFLSFELGKNDENGANRVFMQSLYSYVLIIILIVLAAETIGLWFMNNKMIMPADRNFAANVMFQFSILTFIVNVIGAPYNAAIIAAEKMGIFAYAGVFLAILNLVSALLLKTYPFSDTLIAYSILVFVSNSIVASFYIIYSNRNFNFCKINFRLFDWPLIKGMTVFAFWNMMGAITNLLREHGVNMLLNMFFNPVVNAARGIAMQVSSALSSFSGNFYTAVRPQLVKYFSSGQEQEMLKLGYMSSRYAFLLLFVLTVPFFCETEGVMELWLGNVPDYCVLFARIILVTSLLEVLTIPLDHMMQASGKLREIQISVSSVNLLNIPISYVLLKIGYGPEFSLYVCFLLLLVSFAPRFIICRRVIHFSLYEYLKCVLARLLLPVLITVAWVLIYFYYCRSLKQLHVIILLCIHFCLILGIIYTVGIDSKERKLVIQQVKKRLSKNNPGVTQS